MINLPQLRTFVILIKNGSGIVSLKIFNGYADLVKKIPQYVLFRGVLLHIKDSLIIIGESHILQSSLFKQELSHDEIFEHNWED